MLDNVIKMPTTPAAGSSKTPGNPTQLPADSPPVGDANLAPIPKPDVTDDAFVDRVADRVAEKVNASPRAEVAKKSSLFGRLLKGAAAVGAAIGIAVLGFFALSNHNAVQDQIQTPPAIEAPAPDLIPIEPGQGPPANPLNPATPATPPNGGIATPPGVTPGLPNAPGGVVIPQIQIEKPATLDSNAIRQINR